MYTDGEDVVFDGGLNFLASASRVFKGIVEAFLNKPKDADCNRMRHLLAKTYAPLDCRAGPHLMRSDHALDRVANWSALDLGK